MASPTWDSATIQQASFAYGASPQLLGLFHFRLGHHSTSSFCLQSITSATWPLSLCTQPPFDKLFLPTEHRLSCLASPTWDLATIQQAPFAYGTSSKLHDLSHLELDHHSASFFYLRSITSAACPLPLGTRPTPFNLTYHY
ncbi:hypothetical protein Adt_28194 [Abeliophyllum distichum]|uniref:Uncharacterized protein n=1 Tax=Abeliophyllum distichum TaxID=126358 RepID=A0ABD1RVU8_9LAMI